MSESTFGHTVEFAGRGLRIKEWTAVKERAVRLEVLVKLYKSLRDQGVATTLDENIAAERTKRHLSVPSSISEVHRLLKSEGRELCWRNP